MTQTILSDDTTTFPPLRPDLRPGTGLPIIPAAVKDGGRIKIGAAYNLLPRV